MTEHLKKFEAALRSNRELVKKFEEEIKRLCAEKAISNDGEAYAKAANALGFELTESDLEKAEAEAQQLDRDELDSVAGGSEPDDDSWCLFDYSCYTAYHHPKHKEGDLEPCWSDYGCFTINHHCNYESNPNK